jgi:PAS domain S-box-containing protein
MASPEHGREAADLEPRVAGMFQRFLELVEEVARDPDQRSAALLSEMLQELSSAVEELEVSTEEIRAQNEALEAAQARIDVEVQRYHELFDGAPDGYLVTDENGIILESNRAATGLFRLESRLLHSKPLIVFVHSADRRRLLGTLHEVLAESAAESEVRFAPTGGRAFVASVHATTSPATAGSRRTVRWLIRDESGRVAPEEALALEERYRLVSAHISDVVVTTDRRDRIVYVSPALQNVLYCKWEELALGEVSRLFHRDDRPALATLVEQALDGHTPATDVLRIADGAGGSVSMEVAVEARYDESGEPKGLRYSMHDVHQHTESRLVLQAALTRERQSAYTLREADAAKDALLLAASHDLSSPVAAVAGLADQLVAHPDLPDGELRRMAAGIAIAGSQLRSILTNLLDTERVLGEHVVAHSRTTDLHGLVAGSVRAHGLPTSCLRPRRGPVLVDVDAGLTTRIVDNVVGNALRHTPQGTLIRVSLDRRDGQVVLGVEDRGPGVPDELKDEIFEPFRRHGSHAAGLGLGLFIVRRFAELQGGRSWVEDTEGGGATFKVALPAVG